MPGDMTGEMPGDMTGEMTGDKAATDEATAPVPTGGDGGFADHAVGRSPLAHATTWSRWVANRAASGSGGNTSASSPTIGGAGR